MQTLLHTPRSLSTSLPLLSLSFSTPTLSPDQYVHPLSQIVLGHLQTKHSSFLSSHKLLQSLSVLKDGTFHLSSRTEEGRKAGVTPLKIWTTFDAEERKHFLKIQTLSCSISADTLGNVQEAKLIEGTFMLQDNAAQPWHSSKLSLDERVRGAVDALVEKVEKPA